MNAAQVEILKDAANRFFALALESGDDRPHAEISWDALIRSPIEARSQGVISPAAASAEIEAIEALSRAAGDPETESLVRRRMAANPWARQGVLALIQRADPTLPRRVADLAARTDRLYREASGPLQDSSAEVWLRDPAGAAAPKPPQSGFGPITARMLADLSDRLTGEWSEVDLLRQDSPPAMTDLLTAVMAQASWTVGLRPAEWPSARMSVKTESSPFALLAEEMYAEALEARPPPPLHRRAEWVRHARSMLERQLELGEVWLSVSTRKSGWAVAKGLPTVRSLNITASEMRLKTAVFCAAAASRTLEHAGAWSAAQRRINNRLKRAAVMLFPDRREPLTLYAFRHDFIDRAKSALSPEETAALAGHVSPATKRHYGQPGRGGGGRGLIAVSPDPAHVSLLREHAAQRRLDRAARAKTREAARSPSPSPSPGSM